MNKSNIVLVGMMGTGKSTVGTALAARLGYVFLDTDEQIEREQRMSISDIFAKHGEPEFRRIESMTIEQVLASSGQVIATGGGAVLSERNRQAMKENGWVIALAASAETIISRVRTDTSRPLLQGDLEQRVHTILENRKHAYDFADMRIDTDRLNKEEIVDLIVAGLKENKGNS